MVPVGAYRWRHRLSGLDDHIGWHPLVIACAEYSHSHSWHLRILGAGLQVTQNKSSTKKKKANNFCKKYLCLQWPDSNFHVSFNQRIMVAWSRSLRRQFHRNRAGLHFTLGRRFVWQRRHCDFRTAIHLLFVGEIGENGLRVLGIDGRAIVLLHGIRLGWLRVHHQLDSVACVCVVAHGPIFATSIHQLHDVLHFGLIVFDANSIRRIPTDSHKWTYGRVWCVCTNFGCSGVEAFTISIIEARIQETIHFRRFGSGSYRVFVGRSTDFNRSKY